MCVSSTSLSTYTIAFTSKNPTDIFICYFIQGYKNGDFTLQF